MMKRAARLLAGVALVSLFVLPSTGMAAHADCVRPYPGAHCL